MAIRKPELEIKARIGITPEAYKVLRKLKRSKKQSMVRLVSDLIIKHYDDGNETLH
jgi:predicted CopG family antitoxin